MKIKPVDPTSPIFNNSNQNPFNRRNQEESIKRLKLMREKLKNNFPKSNNIGNNKKEDSNHIDIKI
jgi:hypothetical protein